MMETLTQKIRVGSLTVSKLQAVGDGTRCHFAKSFAELVSFYQMSCTSGSAKTNSGRFLLL